MAAKKENTYWQLRAKHGRDKIFKSPKAFEQAAIDYFQWCDDNPLKEEKVFGTGLKMTVNLKRAYTKSGFCAFHGVEEPTLRNYGTKEEYKDFFGVYTWMENVMYSQKFEGAAVGLFNASIIARDLGLAEQTDNKNTNTNYNSEPLTQEKIKEINQALENDY